MSRIVSVCLSAIVAFVAVTGASLLGPVPAFAAEGTLTMETPLHQEPAHGSPLIALLSEGAIVTIDGPPVDGFYPVSTNGLSGWMRGETLQLAKDIIEESAEPAASPEDAWPVPEEQTASDVPLTAAEMTSPDGQPADPSLTADGAADPTLTGDPTVDPALAPAQTGEGTLEPATSGDPASGDPAIASDPATSAPADTGISTDPAASAATGEPVAVPAEGTPPAVEPLTAEPAPADVTAAEPEPAAASPAVEPAETPVPVEAVPIPEATAAPVVTPEPVVEPAPLGPAGVIVDMPIRYGPGPDYGLIFTVPMGSTVEQTGQLENGFVSVQYKEISGWAAVEHMAEPSDFAPEAPPEALAEPIETKTPKPGSGVAFTTIDLSLRSGPSANAEPVVVVPAGSRLILTGVMEGNFQRVTYGEEIGWVANEYLATPEDPAPNGEATGKQKNYSRKQIVRYITQAAKRYDQSPEDMLRVAQCESNLDPYAVHPSGSYGLFQFIRTTWRSTPYGKEDIFDPEANSNAAAWMWAQGRKSEWVCQ